MSYQVVFLEEAEADMDVIDEYLVQFSEKTADKFIAQVETQTLLLYFERSQISNPHSKWDSGYCVTQL